MTTEPINVPASCDDLYPTDLVANLTAEIPPLNDPALSSFLSTENVRGLEVLGSGVPVVRCTWGAAGTPGLATTVARVGDPATAEIREQLLSTGFTCEEEDGGVVCRFSEQTVDQSDRIRTSGETHWFGGGYWVASHFVDYDPEAYTQALATRLRG